MSKLSIFGDEANIVGKDGTRVAASALLGKVVGVYFSAHWCPPCRGFTPKLAEKYNEIAAAGNEFEIVFVSSDRSEAECASYYNDMPWLLLDHGCRSIKEALSKDFNVDGIPTLVLLNDKGELITTEGREALMECPFDQLSNFAAIKAEKEKKKAETMASFKSDDAGSKLGLFGERNILDKEGNVHSMADFAGRTIGLLFGVAGHPECESFTPKLVEKYKVLNESQNLLEVVYIPFDRTKDGVEAAYAPMPWKRLSSDADELKYLLAELHDLEDIPTLVLLSGDGHTITTEGTKAILSTPLEKLTEFEALQAQKRAAIAAVEASFKADGPKLKLFGESNILDKEGNRSSMADIKASVIGLYFSAHWCGPCRGFTPKLVRKYNQLREAGSELEIVFISSDRSASDAELYYEEMPWCTLDYEDREMKNMLSRVYDVSGIPSLVLLNGDGELITDEGRTVLMDTPFEKIPSYRS